MKNRAGQKIRLTSVEEMLGVSNEESAMEISLAKIRPFKDHPFKVLDDDLSLPLICSRQGMEEDLLDWFGESHKDLDIVASYDLLYNASLMVQEGLGYVLGFEGLIHTGEGSNLCFLPLEPEIPSPLHIIWKKYQVFTPAAKLLLEELKLILTDAEKT